MTANKLKLLACLSMLIDHITYVFIPRYLDITEGNENVWWYIGRGLGRSAFIIFAFLLVEGFFLTGNLKKYVLRMLLFAFIAEAPFDLLSNGRLESDTFLARQNVLFLFVLGLILMYVILYIEKLFAEKSQPKYYILAACACALAGLAAYFLRVDHGYPGLALILVFFFFRKGGKRLILAVMVWSFACIAAGQMLEWAGLLALIPIMYYNGEKGRGSKWFFYIFYPAHMLVLGLLYVYVNK